MSATKSGLFAVVVAGVLGAILAASARPAATPVKIFDNGNIGAVYNGASAPTIFTTSKPVTVTEIWTYHWNDAKGGSSTGTIGLKSLTAGKMYGPFHTVGSDGQGGVPNAYWHTTTKFTIPAGRYRIVDSSPGTWSQNSESGGSGMAFVMALPAAEAVWPALPDALVPLESVSNGCGPGVAGTAPRTFDTSTYMNSNNPLGARYTVNFREACNMHDAGYSGAKIKDPLHGNAIVDTWGTSRSDIDYKFLNDMRMLCEEQITAQANGADVSGAIKDCKGRGGKLSLGAFSRYAAVVAVGKHVYKARPALRGVWAQDELTLGLSQSDRHVSGKWRTGTGEQATTIEFRGTVICRDQDSIVKGFAKVTDGDTTEFKPMSITVDTDHPDSITVAGPGISGTFTRA